MWSVESAEFRAGDAEIKRSKLSRCCNVPEQRFAASCDWYLLNAREWES
jgi:hypothetical protein